MIKIRKDFKLKFVLLFLGYVFILARPGYADSLRKPMTFGSSLDSKRPLSVPEEEPSEIESDNLENNPVWTNPLMQRLVSIGDKEVRESRIDVIKVVLSLPYRKDLSVKTLEEIRKCRDDIDHLREKEDLSSLDEILNRFSHTGAKNSFRELVDMVILGEAAQMKGGGFFQIVADKGSFFLFPTLLRKCDADDQGRSRIIENFELLYAAISAVYVIDKEDQRKQLLDGRAPVNNTTRSSL